MKFTNQIFAILLFTITLPVTGFGQNRAAAEHICQQYDGTLNDQETPIKFKVRSSVKYYTCMINPDSLSIYDQTDYLVSNIPTIQKDRDWSFTRLEKYKHVRLRMSGHKYAIIKVPATPSNVNPDRFHFYLYEWQNKMPDREYRD